MHDDIASPSDFGPSKYSRSDRHVIFDEKTNFHGAKFSFHDAILCRLIHSGSLDHWVMDGSNGQSVGGGFLASHCWSTGAITFSFVPWFCWVGPEVFFVCDFFPGHLMMFWFRN